MIPRLRLLVLATALTIGPLPVAGVPLAMAQDAPAASPSQVAPSVPAAAPLATVSAAPPPELLPGAPAATLPHDLSPWAMFLNADIVVKAVMVGLAFASVFTWTVWIAKGAALIAATTSARRAVALLARAKGLDATDFKDDKAWRRSRPVAAMVETARDEVERSLALPAEGIKERVAIALQRVEARAARAMNRGTGLVATIGSTAPFVGLFGTVWGIMNSFVGISQAHTSNLAVVAPGIAEALLATAIGLVAAIPAVVIFNSFSRAIAGYRALLGDASAEVLRHLSRDLDRHGHRALRAAE